MNRAPPSSAVHSHPTSPSLRFLRIHFSESPLHLLTAHSAFISQSSCSTTALVAAPLSVIRSSSLLSSFSLPATSPSLSEMGNTDSRVAECLSRCSSSECLPRRSSAAPADLDLLVPPAREYDASTTAFEFLRHTHTVFLVDDTPAGGGGAWVETRRAFGLLAPACAAHDPDGAEVHFLRRAGVSRKLSGPVEAAGLLRTIQPPGRSAPAPDLGRRLDDVLSPYLAWYAERRRVRHPSETGVRPLRVIVLGDGRSAAGAAAAVRGAARRLDRLDAPAHQVTLQFFVLGCDEAGAQRLRDLGEPRRDGSRHIVDVGTWDAHDAAGDPTLSPMALMKMMGGARGTDCLWRALTPAPRRPSALEAPIPPPRDWAKADGPETVANAALHRMARVTGVGLETAPEEPTGHPRDGFSPTLQMTAFVGSSQGQNHGIGVPSGHVQHHRAADWPMRYHDGCRQGRHHRL